MDTANVTRPGESDSTVMKGEVAVASYETCPICGLAYPHLIHNFNPNYEADILNSIKSEFPLWEAGQGICSRCFDRFEAVTYYSYRSSGHTAEDFKIRHFNFYVFPIAERMNADENYTGKNITICIIDSGFYPHPDFIDQVIKVVDVTDENKTREAFFHANESAWHGTTTASICSGNGKLNNGIFKGLAWCANLILINIRNDNGEVKDEYIAGALMWVKANHKAYNIKVVNLSRNRTTPNFGATNAINQLAEDLFTENVLVVAAAESSDVAEMLPPASGSHVVAVGAISDNNKLDGDIILCNSNVGVSLNCPFKPELTSNSIWFPAPILPLVIAQKKAAILFQALEIEEYMSAIIENSSALLKNEYNNLFERREKLWREVKMTIWKEKFISPNYMHVEGSLFAAPVVSSVAAQMLEANPLLTVAELRNVLLNTSLTLPTYDIAQQGYGRLQPKMAVYAVIQREDIHFAEDDPIINRENNSITFYIHLPYAKTSVSLSASFNNWKKNEILLKPAKNNIWYVNIPMLPPGRHEYKYFVDNHYWVEDLANPWRVIDNNGGWNNVFEINNNTKTPT